MMNFEEIWTLYPSKLGKKAALRAFKSSVKCEHDFESLKTALENYKKSKRVKAGYVQNGSTWFNNWQDWIDYKEVESEQEKVTRLKKEIGL